MLHRHHLYTFLSLHLQPFNDNENDDNNDDSCGTNNNKEQ